MSQQNRAIGRAKEIHILKMKWKIRKERINDTNDILFVPVKVFCIIWTILIYEDIQNYFPWPSEYILCRQICRVISIINARSYTVSFGSPEMISKSGKKNLSPVQKAFSFRKAEYILLKGFKLQKTVNILCPISITILIIEKE